VILPMPDFYHSDGTWPMRFHSDHTLNVSVDPVNYTVGLILHYSEATARLRLYSCTPKSQTAISVTDCPNEAQDGQNHLIEVTNTGTLRLQMRAPDTTDDCDHHVRYAFHQMLKLLDPNYTDYPKYRYIEPAQGMNINDSGVFETSGDDCFTNDAGDQDDPPPPAIRHPVAAMQENSAEQSNPFSGTLNKNQYARLAVFRRSQAEEQREVQSGPRHLRHGTQAEWFVAHHRCATDGVSDGTFSRPDR
jgi:hypothetical protein